MAGFWAKCLKNTLRSICALLAILLSFIFLHQWILPLLAFVVPSLDPSIFDLAVYGSYPTEQYATFDLPGPLARQLRWADECNNGLVFLTPNGPAIERPGPMIVDAKGGLVWMSDDFGATANLKVQQWKGESYLTLWSGEKAATSGKGVYFMIDSTYEVAKMISAIGEDLFGDLHEFKITDAGTALITVYNTTQADLTGMGLGRGPNGWIIDNLFQEIDLDTGELLFQWRATDHFNPVETYMTNPLGGHWKTIPFDWYHINSIDKDSQGNYLISSRHFHSVTCISPHGEILWILGGRDNQFTDLSDGQATNFRWQHDARWASEDNSVLSLFDNSKAGPLHVDARKSRAMFIQLDIPNKTATLVQSLTSLQDILASSQGSVQVLPDSRQTFVGWGSAAAYSEYSREGELMCETHLAASWSFWFERFKSYRATKSLNWHARPRDPPDVKIADDILYVSWNGATDVAYWSLEMCADEDDPEPSEVRSMDDSTNRHESDGDKFETVDIIPKVGFEGAFDLPEIPADERAHARYRVAALDEKHMHLRYSDVIMHGNAHINNSSWTMLVLKLSVLIGFCIGARIVFKHYRLKRRSDVQDESMLSPPAWMEWKPPSRWTRPHRWNLYEWTKLKIARGYTSPG